MIVLVSIYAILRGRLGLVLTAVRDDETGARSIGARVSRAQLLVFVIAATGCGAAGGLEIISQPFVQPTAAFSVQWTAEMVFACLIGGIGTIEGPILGTIVFFVLQQWLASYGTWYFIVLGAIAIAVAIWAPRGLWGAHLRAPAHPALPGRLLGLATGPGRRVGPGGPAAAPARGNRPAPLTGGIVAGRILFADLYGVPGIDGRDCRIGDSADTGHARRQP